MLINSGRSSKTHFSRKPPPKKENQPSEQIKNPFMFYPIHQHEVLEPVTGPNGQVLLPLKIPLNKKIIFFHISEPFQPNHLNVMLFQYQTSIHYNFLMAHKIFSTVLCGQLYSLETGFFLLVFKMITGLNFNLYYRCLRHCQYLVNNEHQGVSV